MSENDRRVLRRERTPHIMRPVTFRSVTARNRIMLSPMCQYSATDGMAEDWHLVHLGSRAVGGAGIVFTEATHVEPRGRITPGCLGLWNDAQRDALSRIVRFVEAQGAVPGLQLAHAGRKASVGRPWEGTRPLTQAEGGWPVIGPSALAFAAGHPVPEALDRAGIDATLVAFAAAAQRGREAGFKVIELHCAHGYLAHSFLSPLSNARRDGYGGDDAGRRRLVMELIEAVRGEWPDALPLFVRLSCTDWVEGGWDLAASVALAGHIMQTGQVDLIDCSSGGNDPRQKIPVHPGYQVPFAETIRRETGIATAAVGLLHSPDGAEEIIANGRADLVVLGRSMLADPYWPLHAARTLRAGDVAWPVQYERADIF